LVGVGVAALSTEGLISLAAHHTDPHQAEAAHQVDSLTTQEPTRRVETLARTDYQSVGDASFSGNRVASLIKIDGKNRFVTGEPDATGSLVLKEQNVIRVDSQPIAIPDLARGASIGSDSHFQCIYGDEQFVTQPNFRGFLIVTKDGGKTWTKVQHPTRSALDKGIFSTDNKFIFFHSSSSDGTSSGCYNIETGEFIDFPTFLITPSNIIAPASPPDPAGSYETRSLREDNGYEKVIFNLNTDRIDIFDIISVNDVKDLHGNLKETITPTGRITLARDNPKLYYSLDDVPQASSTLNLNDYPPFNPATQFFDLQALNMSADGKSILMGISIQKKGSGNTPVDTLFQTAPIGALGDPTKWIRTSMGVGGVIDNVVEINANSHTIQMAQLNGSFASKNPGTSSGVFYRDSTLPNSIWQKAGVELLPVILPSGKELYVPGVWTR